MEKVSLVPGLGLFGPTEYDCLRVAVPEHVTSIKLVLRDPQPQILNLKKIEFLFQGKAVKLDRNGYTLFQSSVYMDKEPGLLLSGDGMHTEREHAPFWSISFTKPAAIDEVRVFNRGDKWSMRSKTIAIEATDAAGATVNLYQPATAEELLQKIIAAIPGLKEAAGTELTRERIIAQLVRSAMNGDLKILDAEWPTLIQLIDVWNESIDLSEDEIAVLALYLLAQRQIGWKTSLAFFSPVLKTRVHLRTLEDLINRFAGVYGLKRYVLTRHGMSPATLMEQAPGYVTALRKVMGAVDSFGYESFICYGTLLGAARTGTFIPHDDDVDIAYLLKATTREEVVAETQAIKAKLEGKGFFVGVVPFQLNMHVRMPDGKSIDLFPCWLENGKVQFFMERMVQRGIAPEIVFPLGSIELYGERFVAPRDPAGFLAERYGSGWSISDQYYEWPWPLQDNPKIPAEPVAAPAPQIVVAKKIPTSMRAHVDRCDATMVCGWAIDFADVRKHLSISILVDGVEVCEAVAKDYREDLAANTAFAGTQHAFNIPLPPQLMDGKIHQVSVVYSDTRSVIGTPKAVLFVAEAPRVPGALVGKEGWLFLSNDSNACIEQFIGRQRLSKAILDEYQTLYEARQKYLKASGIAYLMAIAPGKEYVYPEYLPDEVVKGELPDSCAQFIDAVGRSFDNEIINLRSALIENKHRGPLCYKNDSHWNYLGAMIGAKALLQSVRNLFPIVPQFEESNYQLAVGNEGIGDLTAKPRLAYAGGKYFPSKEITGEEARCAVGVQYAKHAQEITEHAYMHLSQTRPTRLFRNQKAAHLPRAIILRDSYADCMIPFLTEYFSECLFIWTRRLDEQVVASFKPDLVVEVVVERFLLTNKNIGLASKVAEPKVSGERSAQNSPIQLTSERHESNFSNLLSPWLIQKITDKTIELDHGLSSPAHLVIDSVTDRAGAKAIVWGAGASGCETSAQLCKDAEYRAVRGPLTRNALRVADIECPEIYGDAALLLPLFHKPQVQKTHEVGVILRRSEAIWNQVVFADGVKKIFLESDDIETLLDEILSCKRIVSSSLHGLVIADAYGIPSAWMDSGEPVGLHFKFYDYFLSVNKVQRPQRFNPSGNRIGLVDVLANFDFDARRIEFNKDAFLQACPLIQQRETLRQANDV
ncbi:MAG: polysaccharide pyruvyl transferase family protein [Pseudomonadota bacterium]